MRASPAGKLASSLFLALCFCGFWLYAFGDRFEHLDHGRVVEGHVAGIKPVYSTRGGGINNEVPGYVVSYDGHEKQTRFIWFASVGDRVCVNYLPADPKRAYVQWGSGNSLVNLLFTYETTVFTLLAFASLGLLGLNVRDMHKWYRSGGRT